MRGFEQGFGAPLHTAIAASDAPLRAIRDRHCFPAGSFTKRANGNFRFHEHLCI
jgi:hypothetical protein